jgi:hypothetical protein
MWFVSIPLEQAHIHLSNSLKQHLFKTQWKVEFQFRVLKRDFRLRRGAVKNLALLGRYAVCVSRWLPTFRDNVLAPSSWYKQPLTAGTFKMEPTACPETSMKK